MHALIHNFWVIVWPSAAAPIMNWGHYIEATIGLNVAVSIYRWLARINIAWMTRYVEHKRSWLRLRCERHKRRYPQLTDGLLSHSKDDHRRLIRRFALVASWFSTIIAIAGLVLLYEAAAHPEFYLAPREQFRMAIILAAPLPFSLLLLGFIQQSWVRTVTTLQLRDFYTEFGVRRVLFALEAGGYMFMILGGSITKWTWRVRRAIDKRTGLGN